MGLRDAILGSPDIESKSVYVSEWGVKVTVRGMSGVEREQFESRVDDARASGTIRALVVALCCRDEDGNRIFSDADVPALAAKSMSALGRLYEIASSLSATRKEDIEDIAGN